MPTNRVTTHGPLSAAFRNREEMPYGLPWKRQTPPKYLFIEKPEWVNRMRYNPNFCFLKLYIYASIWIEKVLERRSLYTAIFFFLELCWHSQGLAFSIFFHVVIEFYDPGIWSYSSLFPFVVTRGLKGAVIAWVCSTPHSSQKLQAWPVSRSIQSTPRMDQGFRSVSAEFSVVLYPGVGARESSDRRHARAEGDSLSDLVGGRHWLGY